MTYYDYAHPKICLCSAVWGTSRLSGAYPLTASSIPARQFFFLLGRCYFRIVMAGGNNFAFGGGLNIYPCFCMLNVTVFLKIFIMFGWALRTVLVYKLSVCNSSLLMLFKFACLCTF